MLVRLSHLIMHIIWTSALVQLFAQALVLAGGQDLGGGDIAVKRTITFLLSGNSLKGALINYLRSIDYQQMRSSDPRELEVKTILQNLMMNDSLIKDIQAPNNYVFNQGCPTPEKESFACTSIGELNGQINFEIAPLAESLQGQSEEQIMISLASLALHEHIHHFQNLQEAKEKREEEAELVQEYLLLTAKSGSIPVLEWSPLTPVLVEVRYFSKEDRKEGLHPDFIRVTKSKNLYLNYERCSFSLPQNTYRCFDISPRKLNLVEAWTHGDQLSFRRAFPYYTLGLVLVPVAGYYGGGFLGALVLRGLGTWAKTFLNHAFAYEYFLTGSIVTTTSAVIYKIKSDLGRSSSVSSIANQDNKQQNATIYHDLTVDEMEQQLKIFIESAPHLPVSLPALQEWTNHHDE